VRAHTFAGDYAPFVFQTGSNRRRQRGHRRWLRNQPAEPADRHPFFRFDPDNATFRAAIPQRWLGLRTCCFRSFGARQGQNDAGRLPADRRGRNIERRQTRFLLDPAVRRPASRSEDDRKKFARRCWERDKGRVGANMIRRGRDISARPIARCVVSRPTGVAAAAFSFGKARKLGIDRERGPKISPADLVARR